MTDIVGIIDQAFYGDIGILGKDCRKQHRHRSWLCRLDIEKPAFVDHFPHRFSSLPEGLNHTIRSYIHIPLYIYDFNVLYPHYIHCSRVKLKVFISTLLLKVNPKSSHGCTGQQSYFTWMTSLDHKKSSHLGCSTPEALRCCRPVELFPTPYSFRQWEYVSLTLMGVNVRQWEYVSYIHHINTWTLI